MTARDRAPAYAPNPLYTQEDWDEVSDHPELTDEELSQLRPAEDVLPPELFQALMKQRGRPRVDRPKVPVTIRLDADTVAAFKATGDRWQTRMNDALAIAAKGLPRPATKE